MSLLFHMSVGEMTITLVIWLTYLTFEWFLHSSDEYECEYHMYSCHAFVGDDELESYGRDAECYCTYFSLQQL
jgi:hypothetical protein